MKLQQTGLLIFISIMAASCSSPPVKPVPVARPIEVPVPTIKPKPKPKPYTAKVDRYSDNVAVPAIEVDAQTAIREREAADKKIDAESDRLDPYLSKSEKASDDASSTASGAEQESETSTAVMTLMLRAKVDMLAGRNDAAIDKLERGLRIQPNNPDLWNKLAEAHFSIEDYKQTETMAKKSIALTPRDNTSLTRNNWKLIAKARKEMGDMDGMKAAMRAENL